MIPADDPSTLALLYHLNSEPWLNFEAYSDPSCEVQYKQLREVKRAVPLVQTQPDSTLATLIYKRRSCRQFQHRRMTFDVLSSILHGSYGITGECKYKDGEIALTRTVPSAGGLYPLEIYVNIRHVEHLTNGLYHYDVFHHSLEPLEKDCSEMLGAYLMSQNFVEEANVLVMMSAVFLRTLRKYGPRGYRYILFEAGHCAQNLCLLAAERNLASLCVGGFQDAAINEALGFNLAEEGIVYSVAIGYSAE
jgi:SagB-type dehydrogenase family enzyme